jgi:hypothetical protein
LKAKTTNVAISILPVVFFTISSSVLGTQLVSSDSQSLIIDPVITNQGDLESSSSSELNSKNLSGELLEMQPSDFGTIAGRDFEFNTKKIASELSKLTNEELSVYPITSLSSDDIKLVFRFLNEHELMRLLLNIPQEDLKSIRNMLGSSTFIQTLSKLSEENQAQILNRMSNSTTTTLR